ncbi:MAG: hypothetical protein N3D85_05095 [Candidatus Bathyarchaeota archaeon]|nr:hypothetical protein [Candidatus Bathyarchaeota archaeon]
MKQQKILLIMIAVIIIIVVGGYGVWSLITSNSPRAAPIPNGLTPAPYASEDNTVSQIRDLAMNFIRNTHAETVPLMNNLSWVGGRQETGLLGSETYIYTSTEWVVSITYPVVPNPTYTITITYSSGGGSVSWQGLCENQNVIETSYTSNMANQPASLSTQEKIRDEVILYLKTNHPETVQFMANLSWAGGRQETGLIGSSSYIYTSGSWAVTMQYPVVTNPIYSVNASFWEGDIIIEWQGTYQQGIITETSFIEFLSQPMIRDAVMSYIKTKHSETTFYIQGLNWTGGRVDMGLVGSEKYVYKTVHGTVGGQWWIVEITYPVVYNPLYTIKVNYTQTSISSFPKITWEGTWQNGTITETKYTFN